MMEQRKRTVLFSTCATQELHFGEDRNPERPERLTESLATLRTSGLLTAANLIPSGTAKDEDLLLAHTREHVNRVDKLAKAHIEAGIADIEQLRKLRRKTSNGKAAVEGNGDISVVRSEGDLYNTYATPLVAREAAGAVIEMVNAVIDSKDAEEEASSKGPLHGFALVRPPGHHAGRDKAMGFCYYNNAAIGALHAAERRGVSRVCLFDWDVHHGNGSQDILESDGRVLFASIHRAGKGFFPGTGGVGECGVGAGLGKIVNLPVKAREMGDEYYRSAMEKLFLPIFKEYDPELIVISAGFDAAEGDPLGGMKVTPGGFATMLHSIKESLPLASLVLVLEGGYSTHVLQDCTVACARILAGQPLETTLESSAQEEKISDELESVLVLSNPSKIAREQAAADESLQEAIAAQAKFWQCLKSLVD